ncbi:uncharacterized protein M6B38_318050 [Iris pallida]|uniref:Uncharacterized protein n=1 Tax=Iris pallida TaxID=29817 RepID=A0AAX6HBX7_IRIPA|nr:uncharacterized protein M6B38_318050 [Iris pallida]
MPYHRGHPHIHQPNPSLRSTPPPPLEKPCRHTTPSSPQTTGRTQPASAPLSNSSTTVLHLFPTTLALRQLEADTIRRLNHYHAPLLPEPAYTTTSITPAQSRPVYRLPANPNLSAITAATDPAIATIKILKRVKKKGDTIGHLTFSEVPVPVPKTRQHRAPPVLPRHRRRPQIWAATHRRRVRECACTGHRVLACHSRRNPRRRSCAQKLPLSSNVPKPPYSRRPTEPRLGRRGRRQLRHASQGHGRSTVQRWRAHTDKRQPAPPETPTPLTPRSPLFLSPVSNSTCWIFSSAWRHQPLMTCRTIALCQATHQARHLAFTVCFVTFCRYSG